ncbi:MAG: hypothetical protein DRJ33_06870 [Candidatus Methanomethylicota archaeon]|uniref:Energy-coupling factor transporter transmembrane protein EcfT n=1 Tax=Thermoproteota archaeon TaxID=2056631 RepID=A0A497EVZ6_9CREN|nr:MAG: hypothetical protein DRJ33_06870 [Candidatus Verstraetearchaeota archaeon]
MMQTESRFSRLDPLTKTIFIAVAISIMTYKGTLNYALYVYAFSLALVLLSKLCLSRLLKIYLAFSPFIIGLSWFNAYIASITAVPNPIEVGFMVAARILSLINFSVYFSLTTDPDDLVLSLIHNVRIPYQYAYALSIAYLILVKLLNYYVEVLHSLKGRLAIRWDFEALKLIIPLTASMLAYVSSYVDALSASMEARGFGLGDRSYWRVVKFSKADTTASALALAVATMVMLW